MNSTATPELLRVQGLVKRFDGILATDHFSLSVHEGELVAVIGPNADSLDALVGNSNGTPSRPVTVLAGLREVHADDDSLTLAAAAVFDALYAVPGTPT